MQEAQCGGDKGAAAAGCRDDIRQVRTAHSRLSAGTTEDECEHKKVEGNEVQLPSSAPAKPLPSRIRVLLYWNEGRLHSTVLQG